jgi:hypothetical protein
VGNNLYYATDGAQEVNIGGWKCCGEGGITVVFVEKI